MRPMIHPLYVYREQSDDHRQKLSDAHRKRLGIPEGHARVYGVHVPFEFVGRVRPYATELARLRGYEAAQAFVKRSEANGWGVPSGRLTPENKGPRPQHVREHMRRMFHEAKGAAPGHFKLFGVDAPIERWDDIAPYAIRMASLKLYGRDAAIEWLLSASEQGWQIEMPPLRKAIGGRFGGTDWALVDELVAEGATREEVAEYLGVSLAYLRSKMGVRKREGESEYGSGARRRVRRVR